MKDTLKALIGFAVALCGLFLIIHRRVITAAITGSPMPEMPEWHKKYFKCLRSEEEK